MDGRKPRLCSEADPRRSTSGIPRPRLVVGVDGSAPSMRALAWAAAEAQLRGADLHVIHVGFARSEALAALAPDMLDAERSVLERAVGRAEALAPRVRVTGQLCKPPAGQALVAASEGAEMLVVGSRGLSGLKEVTLGSVSRECSHHALCPVVIIRPPGAALTDPGQGVAASSTAGDSGR